MDIDSHQNLLSSPLSKTDNELDKKKSILNSLNFETLGGDASLLHLYEEIDRGIKHLSSQIEDKNAQWWKKIYTFLLPLNSLSVICYIIHTLFERPHWCIQIYKNRSNWTFQEEQLLRTWNMYTCNNDDSLYTNSNLPKIDPIYSQLIEITCLLIMVGFKIMCNKF